MECAYLPFDLIFPPKTSNAVQSKMFGGGGEIVVHLMNSHIVEYFQLENVAETNPR